jgi:DNA-binding XRE family transcriptional regulator
MLELTKTQTTQDFVELCLRIPRNKQPAIQKLIENLFALADIRYSIRTETDEDDEGIPLEDVFPDLHPGSAIRGLRYRENLTQAQLAEKIGVKRHHISEMENGKRPIGKDMAKRLSEALHTDYKVFL